VDITPRDALLGQLALIAGREPLTSYFELRIRLPRGRMVPVFVPLPEPERAAAIVLERAPLTDVYIGAAPRITRKGTLDAIERVWCVWVDVDGIESLARLRAFEPRPTLVIYSGSRDAAHAYWRLVDPLGPAQSRRANRRLQHHLGADVAATDAARVLATSDLVRRSPTRSTVGQRPGAQPSSQQHAARQRLDAERGSCLPRSRQQRRR
jgi:hypothetical protein